MKQLDMSGASQSEGSDSSISYFSNGLLSKIIHSDQRLARPTEHVLRRRWLNRMVLAEIGFVIGVILLQFFPVIEDSSAKTAAPAPLPSITATATTPSPVPTDAAMIIATATVEPVTPVLASSQPVAVIPVALPDTGADASIDPRLYAVPLLCLGGLALWLLSAPGSTHTAQVAAALSDDRRFPEDGA
jgi:hypothetical protein